MQKWFWRLNLVFLVVAIVSCDQALADEACSKYLLGILTDRIGHPCPFNIYEMDIQVRNGKLVLTLNCVVEDEAPKRKPSKKKKAPELAPQKAEKL
jgi:hypothetical protein